MGRDEMLHRSLVALGMVIVVVGIVTFSFRKMVITYAFGIAGIGLILLPDWEFFDRDFSQWFTPMPDRRRPGFDRAPDPESSLFGNLTLSIGLIIGASSPEVQRRPAEVHHRSSDLEHWETEFVKTKDKHNHRRHPKLHSSAAG